MVRKEECMLHCMLSLGKLVNTNMKNMRLVV